MIFGVVKDIFWNEYYCIYFVLYLVLFFGWCLGKGFGK